MKHLGFSYLIWRMGSLLKHCSNLTYNRTVLDQQQRLECLMLLKRREFPKRTLCGRAGSRSGSCLVSQVVWGVSTFLNSFMSLMAVTLSACHPPSPLTLNKESSLVSPAPDSRRSWSDQPKLDMPPPIHSLSK